MRFFWIIPILVLFAGCSSSDKKETSPLQPPSDEETVQEEETGIFESSKKIIPEEKEKEFKTEFDADGVYWLTEPVSIGKYAINSMTLQKGEAATLTLEVEETADMIDLTAKKFTAGMDTFSVQFSYKELGTIIVTGHFTENPWGENVEETETVVLTGRIKSGSEAEKKVEFTWNSF